MSATTKVITGEVRLSFVNLLEPAEDLNGNLKYSCMVLVPKSCKATLDKLEAAQEAAIQEAINKRFNGERPRKLKTVLRDADEELDLEKYPEAEGCMFMNVSSRTKPGIVDVSLNPVMDAEEVYSGVYARLSVNAYAYNAQGSKGVTFFLNNVMVLGKGERLSGGATAEEDFEEFAEALL